MLVLSFMYCYIISPILIYGEISAVIFIQYVMKTFRCSKMHRPVCLNYWGVMFPVTAVPVRGAISKQMEKSETEGWIETDPY